MSVDAIEELICRVEDHSHGRIKPFLSIAEQEGYTLSVGKVIKVLAKGWFVGRQTTPKFLF